MRYYLSLLFCSVPLMGLVLVGAAVDASAQERVVSVDPGIGTLNEAIDSDTTDTGERIEPENTVYELQAGGYYGLVGTIENRFPLYIRATEGARAQLVPALGEGGESGRAFEPRGDIRLENLYITNRDEAGGFNTRILRVRPDSARVIIDNCHLDYDGQSGLRLDGANDVIKITNSVISNIGVAASLDNGRGIDTRGNDVDTLIFHNNTFYNITSRLVRDDGAFTKYAAISRNTIYNVAQHGISLGEVGELHMKNNFFINAGFLGQTSNTFFEREVVDIDSLNPDRGIEQILDISNNYFYTHPDVIAAQPDSVDVLQVVSESNPAFATILEDATSAIDTLAVLFVEPQIAERLGRSGDIAAVPAVPADLIAAFWEANTSAGSQDDLPNMDNGGGGALPADETLPFNFGYSENEAAYSAGETGLPLGDLNWFGLVGVAVEETGEFPEAHRLVGNYPNPFNPSTTIKFDLARNAEVTIEVFDIAGRKVMEVPATVMTAGSAEVRINAIDAVSGTYVYRVNIDDGIATKSLTGTMTLIK